MNRKTLEQPARKAGPQAHLEFERLLADLSAKFVGIPADQVDSVIDYGLRKILEFFQVDRAGLLRSLPHRSAYQITHVVCGEDVPPVTAGVELPISFHPWAFEKLAEKHEVVSFSRLDDLPPEAYVDRQAYTEWGIRSALDLPIITGGSAVHVIAINSVKSEQVWPEELFSRLQLLGEIFVNALERRDKEQALLESEERLNLAVASAEARLWELDLDTEMIWSTEKDRDFFRLAPGEHLSFTSFLDYVHPEDRERIVESLEKAKSGEHVNVEYRVTVTPGNLRWVNTQGRLLIDSFGKARRLRGISIDVTARKMMEVQLSESRKLLSSLVDSTSDLIWSVDSERFGLLTFNRSLSEYFFNQRGILIEAGLRPEDLFPPGEFVQTWRRFYCRALEEGSYTTEYLVYDGTRTLLLNLNRLERQGEVFGVSVFGKDITERKAMEAQLREHLGEIEQLKLQLEKENIYLREELGRELGFGNIIGESAALNYVLFRAGQVAPTDAAVLILGETGTGKGLIANAIHGQSSRRHKPMVTVNCAALPANLIESELFGREKGAFTGAHARQAGRFEVADGGTIFLDEIGELPLELQSKLLRVLQDGEFERLGSAKTIKVDVRVIASTSRDLREEVRAGRFREDLFYRLNVFPVSIPPLRKRVSDIPELVRFFVDKYSKKFDRRIETIPKAAMKALEDYSWPGNVRELEHVIERAVITTEGTVFRLADRLEPLRVAGAADAPLKDLAAMEREHILRVLRETGWRIEGPQGAARILDLHPSTLRLRMKKLDIRRT
jgi:formate hydrogenlyase transcriptional activator